MKSQIKRITASKLFIFLSLCGSLPFFIFAFFKGAFAFDWLCMINTGALQFIDYFQHVFYTAHRSTLYAQAAGDWGCFPALAYVFYYFLYRITAIPGLEFFSTNEYVLNTYYPLTLFLLYSILVSFFLLVAVELWLGSKRGKWIFTCLLLSAPFFAGAIERGNSVLIIVALLLIALKWRESESKIKRELALVFIATSAGLKIYPAIFGLLYLKDHQYKEAFRLLLYGLILFFVPFAFFGGVSGLKLWVNNILEASTAGRLGRIEFIKGAVNSVTYILFGKGNTFFAEVLPNVFMLIMLVLAFISRSKHRTVFFLCAVMAFYPNNMHRYALTLLAIPLVLFLVDQGDRSLSTPLLKLETILYGEMFSIPTLWGFLTGFALHFAFSPFATYVEVWLYATAYLLVLIVTCHELTEVLQFKNSFPFSKRFSSFSRRQS